MSLPGFVLDDASAEGSSSPRNIVVAQSLSQRSAGQTSAAPESAIDVQQEEEQLGPKRAFKAPWSIRIGGAILALAAGTVNGVALYALSTFVGNHTGSLSKVALGLEDSELFSARDSVALLLSFVFGSSISGVFVGRGPLGSGPPFYDAALLLVACFLVATICLDDAKVGSFLAAAACGVQNGLTTIWGGGTCRTTHVTGICTDVGLLLGRIGLLLLTRGAKLDEAGRMDLADDFAKLSLLSTLGFTFLVGVFLGAHLHGAVGKNAFLAPIAVYSVAGSAIFAYRASLLAKGQHTPLVEENCIPNTLDPVLPMGGSRVDMPDTPRSNMAVLEEFTEVPSPTRPRSSISNDPMRSSTSDRIRSSISNGAMRSSTSIDRIRSSISNDLRRSSTSSDRMSPKSMVDSEDFSSPRSPRKSTLGVRDRGLTR